MNKPQHPISVVRLSGVGKKFNDRWIFRGIDFEIRQGEKISITGLNGSGKSTLLQMIAGYIIPSEGKLTWHDAITEIQDDVIYQHISFASPYLELIEEFTFLENAHFFKKNKALVGDISVTELLELSGIKNSENRQLRFFSSGMKQRVKLTFAIHADSNLLLLDEPLTNLDKVGYGWYEKMVANIDPSRTVIVCSNMVKEESFFCTRFLSVDDFKG